MRRALVCAFSLGLLAASLRGDAPPGYYDSTAGLAGSALKNALHEIIDDHIVIPYDDLFPALYVLWEDSGNPSNVRLIYGGVSVAKSSFSWNREHLWPRSRGVEDTGADTSDLFH
ncbi:MAG TPA: hypothetical protein VFG14_15175, partial [Chthoniobacteraceae bacterium]|nr:hypothetical protein [Chthoniobacteraceae bacterium]